MRALVNTAYFPPIQYFAALSGFSMASVEVMETYRKQTCRNHCVIHGPNGRQTLPVPVVRVNGNHTLTRDVKISSHEPWQKIHWRSILTAYNNSPFFLYYGDRFGHLFTRRFDYLTDLNSTATDLLLDLLKLRISFDSTIVFEKNPTGCLDLRDILVNDKSGKQPPNPRYAQVFEPTHGFLPNLSILDLIFNLGPEAPGYIKALGARNPI